MQFLSLDKTTIYHDHLHLSPSSFVFLDDIIEEDNLCQLHSNIILIPNKHTHIEKQVSKEKL